LSCNHRRPQGRPDESPESKASAMG